MYLPNTNIIDLPGQSLINVTSVYMGGREWNDQLHTKYRVIVYYKNESLSFRFYGSHADWLNNVHTLDKKAAADALCCLLSDARCGDFDFQSFCSEFDYMEDSRKARKIWKACKKAAKKVKRVFGEDAKTILTLLEHIDN